MNRVREIIVTNHNKKALTTKENNPKVNRYKGKDSNLTTGLKIMFTKVNTKPISNAESTIPSVEPSEAKWTWLDRRVVIQTARADTTTRVTKVTALV